MGLSGHPGGAAPWPFTLHLSWGQMGPERLNPDLLYPPGQLLDQPPFNVLPSQEAAKILFQKTALSENPTHPAVP